MRASTINAICAVVGIASAAVGTGLLVGWASGLIVIGAALFLASGIGRGR